jgi:hypothetical protein
MPILPHTNDRSVGTPQARFSNFIPKNTQATSLAKIVLGILIAIKFNLSSHRPSDLPSSPCLVLGVFLSARIKKPRFAESSCNCLKHFLHAQFLFIKAL